MKQQIKAPEKIQLCNEQRAQLSDAELKTGNWDAHRNGWAWLQTRGRSKGYAK